MQPDEAGYFILPRVPPGRIVVWLGTKSATSGSEGVTRSSRNVQVDFRPGETAQVTFDKEGDSASR